MKERFKRVNGIGYRDILWELGRICPCGSGVDFEYCCGSGDSQNYENELEMKREMEFENN